MTEADMCSTKIKVRWITLIGLMSMFFTFVQHVCAENNNLGPSTIVASNSFELNTTISSSLSTREKFIPFKDSSVLNANFKKRDPEGDREGLKRGFSSAQRSGTESGGGGSGDRDLFYSVMRKAIFVLKHESQFKFKFKDGEVIDVSRLEDALRAVTLIPTKKQLIDREGVAVDLFNDPDQLTIWFNVQQWKAKRESEKIQLGFHELLGILTIPDPAYKFSNQLQLAVATLSKTKLSKTEVHDIKVDQRFVRDFLLSSKTINDHVVLSHQCEKFEPTHTGFCLIQSQMQDGAIHQKVYLVEGTPEDFKNNKSTNINVGTYRIITNISAVDLNFVVSMVHFNSGTAEILAAHDCISQGYVKVSESKAGSFCIFARFSAH